MVGGQGTIAGSGAVAPEFVRPLSEYLEAIEAGNRRVAIRVVLDLLDSGLDAERIITDLLTRAQVEVGRGWQEGRWSVAMEHRASAITESALHALVDEAVRIPGAAPEGSQGRAVVACSEGEWHLLPGLMAVEVLRLRGADVTFVGPSVPAADLAAMVGSDPPPVVAVTCSMPLSLGGSWRTISSLREVGMTVVCGGRGFGPDGSWGLALGGDHWAATFSAGADIIIAAGQQERPPLGSAEAIQEARFLRRDRTQYVAQAAELALSAWPSLRQTDAAIRATREDLVSTLKAVESASIVGDPELLADFVHWFQDLLQARGLPLDYVPTAFDLLLAVLPEELAGARRMATARLGMCAGTPMPR